MERRATRRSSEPPSTFRKRKVRIQEPEVSTEAEKASLGAISAFLSSRSAGAPEIALGLLDRFRGSTAGQRLGWPQILIGVLTSFLFCACFNNYTGPFASNGLFLNVIAVTTPVLFLLTALGWNSLQAQHDSAPAFSSYHPFKINRETSLDDSILDYLEKHFDAPSILERLQPVIDRPVLELKRNKTAPAACASPSQQEEEKHEWLEDGSRSTTTVVSSLAEYLSLEKTISEIKSQEGTDPKTTMLTDMSPALKDISCRLSTWDFDMFEVAELTTRPLSFVGFVCLDAYSKLVDIDKEKLMHFLNDVEDSYRAVPYHNSLHGAAVARSVYSFCTGCGLSFTSESMEFMLVLAGLVHDVHHPGLTAPFLSKADQNGLSWKTPISPPLEEEDMGLALKYNDQSPLENMHCAVAFMILRREQNMFLSPEDIAIMRKPLVRAILGTDMAKHAEQMNRLVALLDNLQHKDDTAGTRWYWPAKPPANADETEREVWETNLQEEFVMELFLHAADISNPTLPLVQWKKWNLLVQQEFHAQGDREKLEFGELISPPAGFDRNASARKMHLFTKGFMQYLVLPFFEKLSSLTNIETNSVAAGVNISMCLGNLRENLELWDEQAPPE